MKRGLPKEISLLTVMVMLMSLVPMGVSAVDTSAENKVVVKQESPSVNSTETNAINSAQDVNVSEDKPITTADPLKSETDRTIQTSETLQTSAVENDFSYEDFGTGVCITEYTGSGGNVVVPSTLGGKQVLKLGDNAFSEFGGIIFTAITLSDGVTTIGKHTFWGDTSLTTITLPDNVTTIGSHSFSGCTSLTKVVIPSSVTSIGSEIFHNCLNPTIYGNTGSYAETYANEWGDSIYRKCLDRHRRVHTA